MSALPKIPRSRPQRHYDAPAAFRMLLDGGGPFPVDLDLLVVLTDIPATALSASIRLGHVIVNDGLIVSAK